MKLLSALIPLFLLVSVGCHTAGPVRPDPALLSAALRDPIFLYEILRYAYRWHFADDRFIQPDREEQVALWIRTVQPERDPGDHSEYAQIWIPRVNLALDLKRSEYAVPELKLEINERAYRVERVNRLEAPPYPERAYTLVKLPMREVLDFLLRTRNERQVPEGEQRVRIREAILRYVAHHVTDQVTEPQVAFIAPLSPVANDVWIFWENGRRVFHVTADYSISHPAFWEHAPLNVEVVELDAAVVVSREQVPGSNAFVTRDWMGRVLFNCVILGERVELPAETVNQMLREAARNPGG